MLASWAEAEMERVDLEDKRLNARLMHILSAVGEAPQLSLPAACGGHAETVAAYRFFDNERVTPEKILQPHYERTLQRIAEQSVVLVVQDSTELDVTRPKQQVTGAGPLDGSSRRGVLMHDLQAFTPDGTPLGSVSVQMWTREEESRAATRAEKQRWRRKAPIEAKESFRWLAGLRAVREVAEQAPNTVCVAMADSEGDIYELFAEPRGRAHWLVRAGQNRLLLAGSEDESAARHVRDAALAEPVLFTKEISVRGREQEIACKTGSREQPRASRQSQVEVRAVAVTLSPPARHGRRLPPVPANVVLVREIDPPADDVPVEWLLLTTLPIDTVEQVRQIIQYYSVRFMIEVLFRVLKSGCRVEQRRFEHVDRLLPCVALYLIVAWRTLMVSRLARGCPEMDCEAIFEPPEWKSVWAVTQRKPPPDRPPTLGLMVRLVAQLGGYINRPGRRDPPGPQTVWIGLQRTRDLAWAWTTFGPAAHTTGFV
jgi:hypothetical protein